jgi:hypothetical protein
MFPISNIFHGYFQAFKKNQEIFELGKAEVSFIMSNSHKSSVNTLVKGA